MLEKFCIRAIIFSIPFLSWLDLKIERFFYSIGNDRVEHFVSLPITDFMFNYGPLPAEILTGLSVLVLVLSYLISALKKWRNASLVLILTLAIGSGFFTHMILKDHWGRPRPKQVIEFGGTQEFRPFYQPNFFHQPMPSKSFPCGHCTMGFFFFALALVGKRVNSKPLAYLGYFLAIVLGAGLSITRMAQGGHFFSDTLFSALIMWYTAKAMDWLVYSGEHLYENADKVAKAAL